MHIGTKSTSRVHPHIWCPCTYLYANSSIYRAHAARGKRPRMSLEAVRTASGIHTRAHTSACLLSHKARTGVNQKWRLRPQSRRISKGAAYRRIALSLPRAGANWPLAGRKKSRVHEQLAIMAVDECFTPARRHRLLHQIEVTQCAVVASIYALYYTADKPSAAARTMNYQRPASFALRRIRTHTRICVYVSRWHAHTRCVASARTPRLSR